MILKILSIIGMVIAIPFGIYIWLVWGWYGGFVMAFNAVMNDPKSAADFAFGVMRVILGGFLGVMSGMLVFWLSLGLGIISEDNDRLKRNRRFK
jgi:hypothetical protein